MQWRDSNGTAHVAEEFNRGESTMRTGECLNGSLSLYRSFLVPSFPSVLVNGRWVLDGAMAQVFAHEVGTGVGDQMTLVRDNRIPVCVLLIPLCPIEGLWLMCGFGEVHFANRCTH